MSIRIVARVFLSGLEPMRKLVMLSLAQRANEAGTCYPGMAYIARCCSMTERGARKIVRALQAEGWISIQTGGGRKNTNLYRLSLDRLPNPEHGSGFETGNPEHGSGFEDEKPGTAKHETRNSEARNPEHGSPDSSEIHQRFGEDARAHANCGTRRKTARSPAGSRLPPGFPDAKDLAWAREHAPGLDVKLESERFVDHFKAKAGKDGVKLDWSATWRNWVRRAYGWSQEAQQKAERRAPHGGADGAAWWASEAATEAKAREVGCWPARQAESWEQWRARIRERIAAIERKVA